MNLVFTLSMPGVASWNGKWSGEGELYAIVKKFATKKAKLKAQELIKTGYWHHSFGDGWRARISVKEIDSSEARKICKKSRGFCGYDWMVDNILLYNSTHDKIKETTLSN